MLYQTYEVPTEQGNFGLDELHSFFQVFHNLFLNSAAEKPFLIDFSKVTFWDISALLWSVIALDYYIKIGAVDNKDN